MDTNGLSRLISMGERFRVGVNRTRNTLIGDSVRPGGMVADDRTCSRKVSQGKNRRGEENKEVAAGWVAEMPESFLGSS